jgi:hypothetical protein
MHIAELLDLHVVSVDGHANICQCLAKTQHAEGKHTRNMCNMDMYVFVSNAYCVTLSVIHYECLASNRCILQDAKRGGMRTVDVIIPAEV